MMERVDGQWDEGMKEQRDNNNQKEKEEMIGYKM